MLKKHWRTAPGNVRRRADDRDCKLPMKLTVEFGEKEKNLLEFHFNQLLGTSTILVNHKEVKKHTRWFSEPLKESHEFDIGKDEISNVRIEKERKWLFGQKCRVYVNKRLTKVCEGV